jgi:hypothetical protein
MVKRKTILVNPLDTLVPDAMRHQIGESPAAANTQSAGPAIAQPPSPADISSRIQSLEKENEYIKWLLGGAILLAIML